ncbi:hypothetical protein HU200_004271 [Digitaria exilis]|uniref:Amino acid transporter transmembrane domain-containing protein n=1 Tax=Digitaria exilis TaxID=1010633 RepID=A0A835FTM7_9POAL|nr:hypothetical protein HU200_004271 [Digitaria exilis]
METRLPPPFIKTCLVEVGCPVVVSNCCKTTTTRGSCQPWLWHPAKGVRILRKACGPAEKPVVEEWRAINSRRNAKWWGVGVTVMILSWILTVYTLWQMVEMHEIVPGKRFDRYHELGQYAFGEKLGLWIIVPTAAVVEVGLNIVYMVTGGQSLQKFHDWSAMAGATTSSSPTSS